MIKKRTRVKYKIDTEGEFHIWSEDFESMNEMDILLAILDEAIEYEVEEYDSDYDWW